MLPRVRKLEERFGHDLVVIGCHSGKFPAERVTSHLEQACLRLDVHHPVVNDRQFRVWRSFAVKAWPTFTILDAEGYVIASEAGELSYDLLEGFLAGVIEDCRRRGTLRSGPVDWAARPLGQVRDAHSLRYPTRILIDEGSTGAPARLFISDGGHDRVLQAELSPDGLSARIQRAFGGNGPGLTDGPGPRAAFHEPQGLALSGDGLFVADRRNHAVRRIDLITAEVTRVAGTGELGAGSPRSPRPAGEVPLRSPWALLSRGDDLYIAMAGRHQIWRMSLASGLVAVHAGTGGESLDDGPHSLSTLAQPTGLATDGTALYFTDAESSAIRRCGFDGEGEVETLVGAGLFDFGDKDGVGDDVRLQHPLDLAWYGAWLYVADSYNGRIKAIDPRKRECRRWPPDPPRPPGARPPGSDPRTDEPPLPDRPALAGPLAEPMGIAASRYGLYVVNTVAHRIVRYDWAGGVAETLKISFSPAI